MKKAEESVLPRFFYSHLYLVGGSRSATEYFGISNGKLRVFDRMVMDTDTQPGGSRGLTQRVEFRLNAPGNRSDARSDASERSK